MDNTIDLIVTARPLAIRTAYGVFQNPPMNPALGLLIRNALITELNRQGFNLGRGGMIIYSDGAYNPKTHPEGWGFVTDEHKNDLVVLYPHCAAGIATRMVSTPLGMRRAITIGSTFVQNQNNHAELAAFVLALRIALANPQIGKIRCDSQTVVKSWSKGHCGDTVKQHRDKHQLILEATRLREQFERERGIIEWIRGHYNKADPGWHRV